jgi:hypothetical protein
MGIVGVEMASNVSNVTLKRKNMATKKIAVVLQSYEGTTYVNLYSTKAKALKAIADAIMNKVWDTNVRTNEPEQDGYLEDIKTAYKKRKYEEVMNSWNVLSAEIGEDDEYAIEMKGVDAEKMPS